MKQLTTEKTTLSSMTFSSDVIKAASEALLKNPAIPWRDPEEIPFWRKYFVTEKATAKGLAEGQIRHYITTAALDRDHEIMIPKGADLKLYKKNPVVIWGHDYSQPENIVGKNIEINRDEKGLIALTQFNLQETKAAQVYRLYKGGWIKAWSVGFIPIKGHKPKKDELEKLNKYGFFFDQPEPGEVLYIHDKWSLLEYSTVAVPSNPEALTLSVAKELKLSENVLAELEIVLKEIPEVGDDKNKVILDLGDGEQKKEGKKEEAGTDKEKGKKTEYNCECIECGHKLTTEEHCVDVECPKCGGEMRRVERPGEGRSLDDDITKPSEKNHACTINTGDYDKYRSETREHDGKSYTVRFGIKADGTSEENEYFYSIEDWTAAEAKAHCKDHDGTFAAATKPKEQATTEAIDILTEEIKSLKLAVEEKAGRELSAKNRTLIKNCVDAMAKATEALDALLVATEPEKDSQGIVKDKEKQGLDLSAILHSEEIDLEGLAKEISKEVDISKLITDIIKDKK